MNKHQKYRLKDLEGYRAKKRDYARTPEQREYRKLYMRKWREANRLKHNNSARASYHKHRTARLAAAKSQRLWRVYRMTPREYAVMLEGQKSSCLICGEPFSSSRATHIDHCHTSGRVRGLLCHRCNTKLGWFEKYSEQINAYLCSGRI